MERTIQTFWSAQIAPLITEHKLPNMAADKAAAVAGGWLPGIHPRLRWPYRSASVATCEHLRDRARDLVPQLFQDSAPIGGRSPL